jgi:hypothetical protein
LLEQIDQRHGIDEPLTRDVSVAAVARGRPREALLHDVLAESMRRGAQRRSVRPDVGDEAVGNRTRSPFQLSGISMR